MTDTEFNGKRDYFTNLLGLMQVKIDEGEKWGFIQKLTKPDNMKKAFIYLNTLSRYSPESSNSINGLQVDFIFTQLEKLLP